VGRKSGEYNILFFRLKSISKSSTFENKRKGLKCIILYQSMG